jgi:hypothetical protein
MSIYLQMMSIQVKITNDFTDCKNPCQYFILLLNINQQTTWQSRGSINIIWYVSVTYNWVG